MIKQFLKGRFVPEKMVLRILISVMLLTFAKYSMGKPITYIWDLTELKALRSQPTSQVYKQVVNQANSRMKNGVVAVTDKKTTISGNKHEFESLSIYWWADPQNPGGPYIAKDGEFNPEYKQYDYPRMQRLVENLRSCSKAYYLTGDFAYYAFFCAQLERWFIDDETRMQPDFEYCQFIPGRNDNRGNPQGMIDAYNFNDILESIRLVHSQKSIGRKRMKALKSWFADFAEWMQTSDYGQKASAFKNNQAVAYDVTLYDMYLFTGKKSARKEILNAFYEKRVIKQIDDEGKMPEELSRTRAYDYSLFNLTHLVDFCWMVKNDVRSLPVNIISKVDMSRRYLLRFEDPQIVFPYREMGNNNWKRLKERVREESNRFESLMRQMR